MQNDPAVVIGPPVTVKEVGVHETASTDVTVPPPPPPLVPEENKPKSLFLNDILRHLTYRDY
jgi:hypothetical protein